MTHLICSVQQLIFFQFPEVFNVSCVSGQVVDPEEVTSSIQQSLDSLSLAPIPVITLTCPDLPYEVLDQNATLLQLLAKHQVCE